MRVDVDRDEVRQARVRLVRALKKDDELSPKDAAEVIGLDTTTYSSAVLREFLRAGNVHLRVDRAQGGGRPRKRVTLRKSS